MACAAGASTTDVAAQLVSTPRAVVRWRKRFGEHRIAGLGNTPRAGGPWAVTDEQVAAVMKKTLESTPKNAKLNGPGSRPSPWVRGADTLLREQCGVVGTIPAGAGSRPIVRLAWWVTWPAT
ncbi:helix-turn-helix domain-containing protein [Streptomyces sp. NPDC086782]|uniref:helix-turn-helix domain-containing protein n=1 Tax=Streptomyces sp. NPDC086782 TaxID=3365757 RepID=UPI0038151905